MRNVDVIFPAYINATIGPTGTLRRLVDNIEYLKKRGYNLRVFTLDFLSGNNINDINTPLPSKNRKLIGKMKNLIKQNSLLSQAFLYFYSNRNAKKLVDIYIDKYNDSDVIIFHESMACYSYLKHSKRKNKIKTVLFHHSDGKRWGMILKSWPKLKDSFYYKMHNKRMDYIDNNIDMNVFIAKIGLAGFKQEHPHYESSKLFFMHNGIEDKSLLKHNEFIPPYRLITTGSVIERKGQRHIVEALAKLSHDKLKLFHLDIIGSGNDLEYIESIIKKHKLQENVTLHGSIPPEKVDSYLVKANVFILMSNNEGLPISIIEGMRAGLPIISTPVAGIPEQVDDRNGLLIHPSPDDLVQVFNNMEDYNWEELGKASRKRFEEEFTFDVMLEKYLYMLDKLFN